MIFLQVGRNGTAKDQGRCAGAAFRGPRVRVLPVASSWDFIVAADWPKITHMLSGRPHLNPNYRYSL